MTFAIIPSGKAMEVEVWKQRKARALHYGIPETLQYDHPLGGTYHQCQIVYWKSQWMGWKATTAIVHGEEALQAEGLLSTCAARFLHLMMDLLTNELWIFSKYLIQDWHDWLWTELKDVPRTMRHYLRLNPVHPHNKKMFALRKEERIEMMEAPKSQETTPRWIYGKIPGFNKAFNRIYILALKYMQKEDIKDTLEEVVVPGAEYPDAWHEEHKPRIQFLTKEKDLHFNHPK
ncbi:hypothetical protein PAXRUDRAFT_28924 [Paxillus rubicundulus Ve08.2h10]|uniref:Uncharacterized protein n=1 Tax=Paxillus rubicundulus Ve08.2h10 TaxID=930991 RepID=A0A0D0DFX2_9AGAM|nr:hypothetical protein PAXRUDRAFT_28924 [Paxillus rubicundulus Ve08.2h10]